MLRRPLLVLGLAIALLGAGCGFLRDTSTPSARLVGHWTTDKEDHLYFSTTVQSVGTLIVLPNAGGEDKYRYEVIEEDAEEETVTVDVTPEGGGATERRVYRIPADGLFMREQSEGVPEGEQTEYIFVDTRTEPAPYTETLQAEGKPIA